MKPESSKACTTSRSKIVVCGLGTTRQSRDFRLTITASYGGSGNFNPNSKSLTQVVGFPCDLNNDGAITVADVQRAVNESLGLAPAVNDLNGDGVVNVLDIQLEVNAVILASCIP